MINAILFSTKNFVSNFIKKNKKNNIYKIKIIVIKKENKKLIDENIKKKKIKIFEIKNINKIKKIKKKLIKLKIKIGIIISYGFIIPNEIIKIPKFGFINIHGSLLPKWRGPAPIQRSILNGDKITGLTIIKINKLIDDGKIIYQKKINIKKKDNYNTIINKIKKLSLKILPKIIKKIFYKKIKLKKQNKNKITYAKKILKKEGLILWKKDSSTLIERKIKAFLNWPKTFFYYKKYTIFLWNIKIDKKNKHKNLPGTILKYNKKQLKISTITFPIIITKLQLNNRNIITILDLYNSKPKLFNIGEILK